MAQLREKRVAQTCPLCRKPLPPGPDKLHDLGFRIYAKIKYVVEPNVSAFWEHISLAPAQQYGMDQSRALLLEAAAQGHMDAQTVCGDMYWFGQGVVQDHHLAFVYHEKAAQQGHMVCQYNTGVNYEFGNGCEQSHERAVEWYEKAAGQGVGPAMAALGSLYHNGQGVLQNYERAFELWQGPGKH